MDPIPPTHPPSPTDAVRAALAALEGGADVAVATLVEVEPVQGAAGPPPNPVSPPARGESIAEPANPRPGARLLVTGDGAVAGSLGNAALDRRAADLARAALAGAPASTKVVEIGALRCTVYVEAHRAPDELLVVGAGHIAVPLVRLGAMLGFRVIVLDDREEFATDARFPDAARVVRMDFADPFRGVPVSDRSHVVLVTRAHKYDFDCLRRLLETGAEPRYIGMIGSRRRVRAAFEALLDAGVARDALARVHAPVGLDIGAETPEEIAVSIAAELIRLRRVGAAEGREAASLSGSERVLQRLIPVEEA